MKTKGLWILEWHHASNNIHIQPLAMTIQGNLARFRANQNPGVWVPLFIETKAEVDETADQVRPLLIEREQSKDPV